MLASSQLLVHIKSLYIIIIATLHCTSRTPYYIASICRGQFVVQQIHNKSCKWSLSFRRLMQTTQLKATQISRNGVLHFTI